MEGRALKAVALVLTVLTGFTGLVYEVTWQKCLAILLGSHSEATAAVLGIFLGGLSVGYGVFGRVTRWRLQRAEARGRPARLLLLYGFVEAAIGLHALGFPALFGLARRASQALPQLPDGAAFGIDVGLTALLIGPPTVLMGGTIPILTQALARDLEDATRVHAHVYAFNTAGAFAGALAAGFVLVPWLGLEGVLLWMGLLNLAAGSVFLWLGRRRGRAGVPRPTPATGRAPTGFAVPALAALLLGFAMMTTQTVLIRIGGLSLGASHFTFAMVVAVFVLCIALGSFAVSAAPRIPRPTLPLVAWALAALLGLVHLEMENAPYHAHVLRTAFGTADADFHPYHLTVFGALLAVLALPIGLSGATLPLLFHHLRREVDDLGAVAGRLYSWNTVGSLLGALLGGYVLLLWLDLHEVYRVGLAAVALAAVLLTARVAELGRPGALALLVAAGVAVVSLPSWDPYRLSSGLFRKREATPLTGRGADLFFASGQLPLHFHTDDPTATVAVRSAPDGHGGFSARAIINNGKSDGATAADLPTMVLIGVLPCLLADACERSFVVGFGTGMTAGALARVESMREVVVAEISRGVVEAAPLFDFANHGASENPRIRIVRSDAYRALLRSRKRFDAIVSEPSNPWVTGVEMLYSREFLEAARDRLRPGGIYAQWFHLYSNDDATVELVLRTYRSVFEEVAVWYTLGPDILLLGFRDPGAGPDLDAILERFHREDLAGALARAGIERPAALLAHELLPRGVLGELELEGPVHTLLHPRLSHQAARAFFRGGRGRLPSAARAAARGERRALLGRLVRERGRELDDAEARAVVGELCGTPEPRCATALAWWEGRAREPAEAREALATLRRKNDGVRFAPATLEWIRLLLGAGPAPGASYTYAEAVRATEIYERHYAAPLPFDPEVLARVWSRCRDAEGRCTAGRRAAQARLDLPLPAQARTARPR